MGGGRREEIVLTDVFWPALINVQKYVSWSYPQIATFNLET